MAEDWKWLEDETGWRAEDLARFLVGALLEGDREFFMRVVAKAADDRSIVDVIEALVTFAASVELRDHGGNLEAAKACLLLRFGGLNAEPFDPKVDHRLTPPR